ncbi:MAG: hypothetical protein Q7S92_04680 [Candidatus Diapherotrites archaeon]|nr:hypothetical protein [Candidatus Diapherotrites archaeon]
MPQQLSFKFIKGKRFSKRVQSRRTIRRPQHIRLTREGLGSGLSGIVVVGRKKRGNRYIEVAVKRFRHPLKPETVEAYQKVIKKLRNAKLPLIKTEFTRYKRAWTQVMELVEDMQKVKLSHIKTPKTAYALSKLIIEIVNTGYAPAIDSISATTHSGRVKFVIADIDLYAIQELHNIPQTQKDNAIRNDLRYWFETITQGKAITREELMKNWKTQMKNEQAQRVLAQIEQGK